MNIVLLSGGSGKRLWPLSNDIRSKQFLKILKKNDGSYESMIQRVYRQIREINPNARITIATSETQVSSINNQLGNNVEVCVEPCRRDTFPAIVLATAYLHDILNVSENEVVIVCPVDPYVDEGYFRALRDLELLANEGNKSLYLMGVEPTYPSEKYGYIIPHTKEKVSNVNMFKEKPNIEQAQQYIEEGALWNAGVFAYKLKYVLQRAKELINYVDYCDLLNRYKNLEHISFDYAVVEKEIDIQVMRFSGEWKDLGTWNTLTESMKDKIQGNVVLDDSCEEVNVINELDEPILCMGLKNVVVSASVDGILVSDKEKSSYIKPYVEKIERPIMFAEKSWGEFQIIDVQENSLTLRVKLKAGQSMNYHSHIHRDEVWTIVLGEGQVVIDGVYKKVCVGDTILIKAGQKHTVIAEKELKIIEVQIGKDISAEDKIQWEL